ncbi:hypothetical protein [Macrococcus sp. PK]|uniref:hypothetical protein n=1 Tax=Macrococcus sp. PK TaxID=2801919 RepID=UPI001F0F6ACD|nr:hypothetical protein [Macrococcus sp. PK]MCH4983743.1 hypothetical protein [Macrococcus sp. PK]
MQIQKLSGVIIIIMAVVMMFGYMNYNNKLSDANKKIKTLEKNEIVTQNTDKNISNTNNRVSNKESEDKIEILNSFNDELVSNLYDNEDINKKNKYLSNISNNEALDYFKKYKFIISEDEYKATKNKIKEAYVLSKSGVTDEEKLSAMQNIDTSKPEVDNSEKITTSDINFYTTQLAENEYEGLTLFKVTVEESDLKTDTLYIMKAKYLVDGENVRLDDVVSISPLTEEKNKELFDSITE